MTIDELIQEIMHDSDCFPMSAEPSTSDTIASIANMHNVDTALELGTWTGLTTVKLSASCRLVITVDHEDYTKGRLDQIPNIRRLKQDTLAEVKVPVDLVYFDSCHNGDHVLKEAETHWRFINPGGLLIFHDTISHLGPREAVNSLEHRGLIKSVTLRTTPNPSTGAINGLTIATKL